jgi:hypothetical protein
LELRKLPASCNIVPLHRIGGTVRQHLASCGQDSTQPSFGIGIPMRMTADKLCLTSMLAAAFLVSAAAVLPASSPEAQFLSASNAAMIRMHADMSVRASGDVDADFVAMMVPHHQGAIDMAQTLLRYGSNEQLRRIAQEIIVEQQQEIAAMHLALGQPLPPSMPAPDQRPAANAARTK